MEGKPASKATISAPSTNLPSASLSLALLRSLTHMHKTMDTHTHTHTHTHTLTYSYLQPHSCKQMHTVQTLTLHLPNKQTNTGLWRSMQIKHTHEKHNSQLHTHTHTHTPTHSQAQGRGTRCEPSGERRHDDRQTKWKWMQSFLHDRSENETLLRLLRGYTLLFILSWRM